jgi:hypothetical protein
MPSKPLIASSLKIFLLSFAASSFVLAASLVIQWLVYDDWLHRTGSIRIVGTSIAAILTFGFVLRWQLAVREERREMVRRFEVISRMNDRIRNALQAIECVTYVSQPQAMDSVKQAVDAIDSVLRETLAHVGPHAALPLKKSEAVSGNSARKSA